MERESLLGLKRVHRYVFYVIAPVLCAYVLVWAVVLAGRLTTGDIHWGQSAEELAMRLVFKFGLLAPSTVFAGFGLEAGDRGNRIACFVIAAVLLVGGVALILAMRRQ